ncbi:glycogen-binding domain-containing protein [Planctomycetota bacterium]|nr:glycogen-binding domain-containing protein [Planctomycetota bacterium]
MRIASGSGRRPFVVEDALIEKQVDQDYVFKNDWESDDVSSRRYRRFCKHRNEEIQSNHKLAIRYDVEADDILTNLLGEDDVRIRVFYGASSIGGGILLMQPYMYEREVCVAGNFNNWSMKNSTFSYHERLNVWYWFGELRSGRYQYRLVIDGQWSEDLFNRNKVLNEFGDCNHEVWCM